jgi:phosphoribosylformylglycinamidine synthase
VFRAHSSADLDRSIGELAATIGTAEILMFPGGFSAGDEPDGSGKYIAAVFRDPRLLDAVRVLVERNDGLILGICNGFQALVRMGLLPGGADRLGLTPEMSLYLNAGLHHISAFVETRVSSTRSPWLAGTRYRSPTARDAWWRRRSKLRPLRRLDRSRHNM